MTRSPLCIGVHVHAEPMRLQATLASLRAHAPGVPVVLLPDGPDDATRAALASLPLPQLGTAQARGAPACWNRLAAASDAEVIVFLESGAQLAPGALGLLSAALLDPRHGLAGPSTNLAWNEQCAFRGAGDGDAAIAATARAALAGFGDTVRPLTPLHSLADFCIAARRDVIDAVGAADEGYGLGPCWEMDYGARAARAGFLGVWVCGAYVHRAPFTARRRQEEGRRFDASRRRYQDKLCGRRLRGQRGAYEPHCKGDACPDFAPPALIRIREALRPAPVTPRIATPEPAHAISQAGDRPFVSCIMPTRDRRAWLPQAIHGFLRQDFTDAELVVVDDGDDRVEDLIPCHPRVRYHRVADAGRLTVGAKRNQACRLARGEVIAHWDDDDWYAPSRLRRQVDALRAAAPSADLCGTSRLYFYRPADDQAWLYQHASLSAPMLVGTSLMYRRRLWERAPFADVQVGEDVRFVRAAGGAPVDLADPTLWVATIHPANTSPRSLDTLFWRPHAAEEIHRLLGADLAWYQGRALPLISCIMPTRDRRRFVTLSLRAFREQDWPARELIVVDDGVDPVEDVFAGVPGVRYLRVDQRMSIGAKRNLACSEARGELVIHWDDDDWYAPGRLTWQAAPILAGHADLSGLENRFVLELPAGVFWTTHRELHQRMFVGDVHGGTLMFRRALFAGGLRYPDSNLAEDAELIRAATRRGARLARLANPELFVYVRHGRNAWQFEVGRFLDARGWETVPAPASLPRDALDAYRIAAAV